MDEKLKYKGIVISIDDRTFSKDFGKDFGKFSIKIPLPFEKSAIISSTSRALGGLSVDSMPKSDYEYIRMIITLNSVITDKPSWWEGADKCPDDDFLSQLWRWYIDCEIDFARRLQSKSTGKNMEKT